jgi:cyanophycinase
MISKTLLLTGSGEFTEEMKYVDSYALSFADQSNRKVAIIPTAAGKEKDYQKWVKMAQEHFANYGYDAFGVDILTREDAQNTALVNPIKDATMVYFSGGDPGYLWHTIKDTYLMETVVEVYNQGVVLAGSSAGAWIMGTHVLTNVYDMLAGEQTPVWEESLGLVKYSVLPHYNRAISKDKEVFDRVLTATPDSIKSRMLGIDENTSLLLTDDVEGMVLGRDGVHVLINGVDTEYKSGSFFTL